MSFRNPSKIYLILFIASFYFLTPVKPSSAQVKVHSPTPKLYKRAIELGLSGSLTVQEGITSAATSIRGGTFFHSLLGGLAGAEIEISYSHIREMDLFDFQGYLSWQCGLGNSSAYLYFAFGGGGRQEWLGSFAQFRYPVGFNFGIRTLFAPTVGLRTEYKFRHILHDPVEDFNEHQIVLGISLFVRNHP